MPVIKVASNSRIYAAMPDDMDVNAGALVEGTSRIALRDEMIEHMRGVINGAPTQAERHGMDVFTFMTVHPPF